MRGYFFSAGACWHVGAHAARSPSQSWCWTAMIDETWASPSGDGQSRRCIMSRDAAVGTGAGSQRRDTWPN